MDLTALNLANLTQFWILNGKMAGYVYEDQDLSISWVANSDWPNKLWFHKVPSEKVLALIIEKYDLKRIHVVLWGNHIDFMEKRMQQFGFMPKSTTVGMSMSLDRHFPTPDVLQVKQVHHAQEATLWSRIFHEAFTYHLHADVVRKTLDRVAYYIAYIGSEPVGTIALYIDDHGIAGLYSLGILKTYRRRGLAEQLLLYVLQVAKEKGATLAILQASAMGKDLYLRMGFTDNFMMKNYAHNQQTQVYHIQESPNVQAEPLWKQNQQKDTVKAPF